MPRRQDQSFRVAAPHDLASIEAWLRLEREQTGEGFYCNWSIIKRGFDAGNLFVLGTDDDVLGFVLDAPGGPDILEVRPNARKAGYGRRLAELSIAAAYERGISVMEIECAPATSIPFWQKMGFTVVDARVGNGGGAYAFRELERRFKLTTDARTSFSISFYPESRRHELSIKPFRSYAGAAASRPHGLLQLPERAICYAPDIHNLSDCVVCIAIEGQTIFEDRVKYEGAKAVGVMRDAGYNYYLDQIRAPDAS